MAENSPYQKLEVIKSIKFLQIYHEKREAVGALLSNLFFTHSRASKQKNCSKYWKILKHIKRQDFSHINPLEFILQKHLMHFVIPITIQL